jgi:hypothetical protein
MATIEELSSALIKADAAGNAEDAKAFADAIRKMRTAAPAPESPVKSKSFTQETGQFLGNVAAGALRGAGSIGASLIRPFESGKENG